MSVNERENQKVMSTKGDDCHKLTKRRVTVAIAHMSESFHDHQFF
jgi:hypothetical protein